MPRLHPVARLVVTETLATIMTAGGCALGIAGLLVTCSHLFGLFIQPYRGIPDELGISMLLLVIGLLAYRFGRRLRS